jgi:hypothetical protein
MDEVTALRVIETLANGVHPATGEILPEDNPCQQPDVLRALWLASRALEERRLRALRQSALPANVGKPWSEEENNALIAEFKAGRAMAEMASLHQRTQAGIQARLEKLGLVPAGMNGSGVPGRAPTSGPRSAQNASLPS